MRIMVLLMGILALLTLSACSETRASACAGKPQGHAIEQVRQFMHPNGMSTECI